MTMRATVLKIKNCSLLVRDHSTSQEVVVHIAATCQFRVGDQVCIQYSGAMTMSIPPQISATCITRISTCGRGGNRSC